jgi:dTDP-4-dehydrorhamnose 3,5-epimerase
MIDGVVVSRLDPKPDDRGFFLEAFSNSWGLPIDPRQWSIVSSRAGTLRGMHFHLRHDECVLALEGRLLVGLHDLRPDSPTSGASMMIEIDGSTPTMVVFPAGLVHGWYSPVDSIHMQGVSESYVDYGQDDNLGCHYADPALGLAWPAEPVWLSERSRSFPPLAALRQSLTVLDAR